MPFAQRPHDCAVRIAAGDIAYGTIHHKRSRRTFTRIFPVVGIVLVWFQSDRAYLGLHTPACCLQQFVESTSRDRVNRALRTHTRTAAQESNFKVGDKVSCDKPGIIQKMEAPGTGPFEAKQVHVISLKGIVD